MICGLAFRFTLASRSVILAEQRDLAKEDILAGVKQI